MLENCKLCQSPAIQGLAFIAAIVLLLFAIKLGVEGLVE